MATTIQNFFTKAAENQFSRDFLFRVRNISLTGGIDFVGDNDLVYAKTAALPGRDIDDKVVSYFGQEFHVPGRSTYPTAGGYTISFYHDEDCLLRTKFEAASRIVFNNETSFFKNIWPNLRQVRNNSDKVKNYSVFCDFRGEVALPLTMLNSFEKNYKFEFSQVLPEQFTNDLIVSKGPDVHMICLSQEENFFDVVNLLQSKSIDLSSIPILVKTDRSSQNFSLKYDCFNKFI